MATSPNPGAPLLLTALALLLVPLASAGVNVDLGVAAVVVDDIHGTEECSLPTQGAACPATLDAGASPAAGDDRIILRQDVESLTVTARPERVPIVGEEFAPLLPDGSVRFRADEYVVEQPVMAFADGLEDLVDAALPVDLIVDVEVDEKGWVLHAPGREPWTVWSLDGNHTWSYDAVRLDGPQQDAVRGEYVVQWAVAGWCESGDATQAPVRDACREHALDAKARAVTDATPDVEWGAEVDEVRVRPNGDAAGDARALTTTPAVGAAALDDARADHGALPRDAPTAHSAHHGRLAPAPDADGDDESPRIVSGPSVSAASARGPQVPAEAAALWARTVAVAAAGLGALALPLWVLYRRIVDRDVLKQETRRAIAQRVNEKPGVNVASLATEMQLSWKAVEYHVRVLQKAGHVTVRRHEGHVLLFPPHVRSDTLVTKTETTHPVARSILLAVARDGRAARKDLVERVDAPPRTVDWHLKRLVERGYLEREGSRATRTFALPHARREDIVDDLLGFAAPARATRGAPAMAQTHSHEIP